MESYLKLIFLLITSLLCMLLISISCDENFNPKTEFHEQYVLNCILGADSSTHFATLSRTYDVPGFNPEEYKIDPAIRGAQIKLISRGITYFFRDTSVARPDTSRYKDDLHFYYLNNFTPHTLDSVKIIAVPKEGVTLTSETKLPSSILIFDNSGTVNGDRNRDLVFAYQPPTGGILYSPRLHIIYSLKSEGQAFRYRELIPISYNSDDEPVYPEITNTPSLYLTQSTVEKALLKFVEGKDKNNYQIINLEVEVLSFEEHVSGYISSTSGINESLSLRLDQMNYTNINGGLGIFGSYTRSFKLIPFDRDYLRRLGF